MYEPILSKREPRPYDFQEMTWGKFIKLREWAKKAANEIGYPIYLVGSTLQKEIPRDFDISVIIPKDDYVKMHGKLPENEKEFGEQLRDSFNANVKHYFDCVDTLGESGRVPLDFKICCDTWFTDKDKLLLAEPRR